MSDNSNLPKSMQEFYREQQREREKVEEFEAEIRNAKKKQEDAARNKEYEMACEEAMKRPEQKEWLTFYYTHLDNLQSILKRGILSPANVRNHKIKHVKIDNEKVNMRRNKTIATRSIQPLWQSKQLKLDELAHVFFNPVNAMRYKVLTEFGPTKIVIIGVMLNVSDRGIYITDRNAAINGVQCWDSTGYYKIIPQIERDTLPIGRWFDLSPYWCNNGSKGRVMAECLVQDKISSDHFKSIYVYNDNMKQKIRSLLTEAPELEIKVIQWNDLFNGKMLSSHISLESGKV